MTIPESTQLILQAGTMGKGGEIYVLDMGEPVKVAYLAEQLIRLTGKKPGEDIEIVYTGLRPGEKLYEELFHESEHLAGTSHPKIMLANSRRVEFSELQKIMRQFEEECVSGSGEQLRRLLCELVPENQLVPDGEAPPSGQTGAQIITLPKPAKQ
jgi:FlaA1/EpsC-like NDP-sugar epimerase